MKFAANLSMMFQEHAFLDRFKAAADAGFGAVEFLFPYEWPVEDIATRLQEHNLDLVLFNLSPGNWQAGERGLASLPGRTEEFRESVAQAIRYAMALSCPRLHAMAGVLVDGDDIDAHEKTYRENIAYAGEASAKAGLQLMIEPINRGDIPGYFLSDFGDAISILDDIGKKNANDNIKLQFDIYHCAKIHGDVPAWIEKCARHTAHYQIAGIPDRHEPDVGSLPFVDFLQKAENVTPGLAVGCEYRPRAETVAGLGWLNAVKQGR